MMLIKKIFNIRTTWFVASYFLLALFSLSWFGGFDYILAGDFSWPQFFTNFFRHTVYFWDDSVSFGYSASRQLSSIFPYAAWGVVLEKLGFGGGAIQRIIFYFAFAISGVGMFLMTRKLKIGETGAFLSGLIYMFSPYSMIVVWNPSYGLTFPFYCFFPLSLYLFIVFLTEPKKWLKVGAFLMLMLSFFGASYSNPAFLVIFLGAIFVIFIYFYFNASTQEKRGVFLSFSLFLVLYFLINSFWILPFISDIGVQYESSSNAAAGLIDDSSTMKLNSVLINEAFRGIGLWTLGAQVLGEFYYDWLDFYNSYPFVILSFVFAILVIIPFAMKGGIAKDKNKKIILLMFCLLLVGILLNAGFKAQGFLRKLMDMIFFSDYLVRAYRSVYLKFGILLALPIAFLVGYVYTFLKFKDKDKENWVLYLISIIFLVFMARPFLDGRIVRKDEGDFISAFATTIPDEYYQFRIANTYDKLLGRYLSLPIPQSYNLSLKWDGVGFQGADFMRFFLNANNSLIYNNDGKIGMGSIVNAINDGREYSDIEKLSGTFGIRNIFIHKDINKNYLDTTLTNNLPVDFFPEADYASKYFQVVQVSDDNFLPQLSTAQKIIFSHRAENGLVNLRLSSDAWQNRSVIFFDSQNSSKDKLITETKKALDDGLKNQVNSKPVLEFRKINPIKYRIRIHSAQGIFPLIFSESFNDGWKVYGGNSYENNNETKNNILEKYKILDGNEGDQATKEELKGFIENGYVTTLGDQAEKIIEHKKWENNQEKLDYIEKYNIDFISKNFQDTIQNDNLPKGNIFETWFKKPIENNQNQLMANGYANAWIIDVEKICGADSQFRENGNFACIKNSDGTHDFEVIVEFWPQRLFYVGLFISLITLGGCVGYLFWDRRATRHRNSDLKSE